MMIHQINPHILYVQLKAEKLNFPKNLKKYLLIKNINFFPINALTKKKN